MINKDLKKTVDKYVLLPFQLSVFLGALALVGVGSTIHKWWRKR